MKTKMSVWVVGAAFAVCAGSYAAGAAGVHVLDCKGREFDSPTCMTEERMLKIAGEEFPSGGVKVVSLDLRIQKCAKEALEKYVDTKNIEFATAVILDVKSGATLGAAEKKCGHELANMFRYADAIGWEYEPGGLIYPIMAALAAESGREWESLGSALESGRSDVFEELREKDVLKNWINWDRTLKYRVAKGRDMKLDSLQIARSYGVLANLGTYVGTYGVERMIGTDGKVLKWHEQSNARRVLNAEIAVKVCRALEKTVTKNGICQDAKVEGLKVAGMSGTASLHFGYKSPLVVYGQSFAGFFPVENPNYVVVVTFVTRKDEPMVRGGGRAARTFAEIAKRIMDNE